MPFVPGNNAHGYNAKDECTQEAYHKGRGYHAATMLLVLSTLSRCELYVALFAMDMGLWLEHSCYGLNKRLGCIVCLRSRQGRDVGVLMAVGMEFDIVILCYYSVLMGVSADISGIKWHRIRGLTAEVDSDGVYRFTGWSPNTSS
jgi:hypothetical protein